MNDWEIPAYMSGRTGDKALAKIVNRALLLDLIRRRVRVSRASLAKESGLTKVTVSSQVADLISLGIVKETGTGDSDLGRKPVMLEIDGTAGSALGFLISTENIHAVEMDLAGNISHDEIIPIEKHDPDTVAEAIAAAAKKAKRRERQSKFGLFGIGIAIPGAVQRETGRVVRSAKLNWSDTAFMEKVAAAYEGLLQIGNDAAFATLAEHQLYNPGADDFVCLLIDEGIGSGAYINGTIHSGHNGQYGEVGHMSIVHDGPRCPCGNRGCWDLYGSELALRQALGAARGGRVPGQKELIELAAARPAWTRKAFADFIDYLTTGVVSVINFMDPSIMVINSAVLAASPEMFRSLRTAVGNMAMAHAKACQLKVSSLGKTAPAIGAAMATVDKFYEKMVLTN